MPAIELWVFTLIDPLTGKRQRTTYRPTLEEARERYRDPKPVPSSLEVRQVSECGPGDGRTRGSITRPAADWKLPCEPVRLP